MPFAGVELSVNVYNQSAEYVGWVLYAKSYSNKTGLMSRSTAAPALVGMQPS